MRFVDTPEYKKELEKKKDKQVKEITTDQSPNLQRRRSSLGELFIVLSNSFSKGKKETKKEEGKTSEVVQKLIKRQNSMALGGKELQSPSLNGPYVDSPSLEGSRKTPDDIFQICEVEEQTTEIKKEEVPISISIQTSRRRSSVFSQDGNLTDLTKQTSQLETFKFGESTKPTNPLSNLKLKLQKLGGLSPDVNKKEIQSPRGESFGQFIRRFSVTSLFDHGKTHKTPPDSVEPDLSKTAKTPEQKLQCDDFDKEDFKDRSFSLGNENLSDQKVNLLSKIFNKFNKKDKEKDGSNNTCPTPRRRSSVFSETSDLGSDDEDNLPKLKNMEYKLEEYKM